MKLGIPEAHRKETSNIWNLLHIVGHSEAMPKNTSWCRLEADRWELEAKNEKRTHSCKPAPKENPALPEKRTHFPQLTAKS